MDNAQKAIIIGVSVFITIAIITAVIVITSIGTDTMNSGNQRLEGVSASVASQLLASYDVKEITGANVISSIKKFYDKENFLLCVDDFGMATLNQKYYSTLKKIGSTKLEPSMSNVIDGHDLFVASELKSYACVVLASNAVLSNNTPNISNLSSNIKSTDKYMAYIIYREGTDTMLGIYFKKIS